MVSMKLPFSLPKPTPITTISAIALTGVSFAAIHYHKNIKYHFSDIKHSITNNNNISEGNENGVNNVPLWGCLTLGSGGGSLTEERTGVKFDENVDGSKRLLGVGLRRKCLFGLKNIDIYAFGVYADNGDINEFLGEKYGNRSPLEMKEKEELINDLMESDIGMTVRLQIVYGKLSIRSVRSAFEESVGTRLQKYGGSDNKELLQWFTSQFKDEYKIPRGSIIDLSRERGNVLRTTIDGKDVGSIESKLLCRSVLDLYIGDDPFDLKAKENIELNLASLIPKLPSCYDVDVQFFKHQKELPDSVR